MNLKILPIRVDGNEKIGYGHFFRTLSLADILRVKYQPFFFHRDLDQILIERIIIQGFDHFKIPENISENDEAEFIGKFSSNLIKLIILDGYQFSDNYQWIFKRKGFKIINIADEDSSIKNSDIVISQAPLEKYNIHGRVYAGFEYSLLRHEFYEEIDKTRKIPKTDTVFLMFGSSRTEGIGSKVLGALLNMPTIKEIHIIKPSESVYINEIKPLIRNKNDNFHLYENLNSREIIQLIYKCDIGIVPSSVISLEVCTVGLGLFSGYTARNQIGTYKNHVKLNTIFPLGDLNYISQEEILRIIKTESTIEKINHQIRCQKKAFKDNTNLILEIIDNCLTRL